MFFLLFASFRVCLCRYSSFETYHPKTRTIGEQFDQVVLSRFPTPAYPRYHPPQQKGGRLRWWSSRRRAREDADRADMTHLDVYTIDPSGSDDADDGFSLEGNGGKYRLHVHVCDPTELFGPWDETFRCALQNGTSYYPSGRRSRRMFSRAFAEKVSLCNGERNALTTTFFFSVGGELEHVECRATRVLCRPSFRFDHRGAARAVKAGNPVLKTVQSLADSLERQLAGKVHFTSLDYLRLAYPRVRNPRRKGGQPGDDRVRLVTDSEDVVRVKMMVAKLSVATNGFIASILDRRGGILGERLVSRQHELPYCQFTSPLRRIGDCVIHFEIKRMLAACHDGRLNQMAVDRLSKFGQAPPAFVFTDADVCRLADAVERTQKQRRELQQINVKFRFLQYIHQRLGQVPSVTLRLRPQRLTNTSASVFIEEIEGHRTRFLYHVYDPRGLVPATEAMRRALEQEPRELMILRVTRCTISDNPYHNNTLPELDALFCPRKTFVRYVNRRRAASAPP